MQQNLVVPNSPISGETSSDESVVTEESFGDHDWQNMTVADWSQHTDTPGMYIDERRILYKNYMPRLLRSLEGEGVTLMDIGCGLGDDSIALARLFPKIRVVGVDFNRAFLEKARNTRDELAQLPENRDLRLKDRVEFHWADLRTKAAVKDLKAWKANGEGGRAVFYMGGNTIGIVPDGIEQTLAWSMDPKDQFLVVAHDMLMLPEMYESYYAKCVGKKDEAASDFSNGLYVSEDNYRSQWFSPKTLTTRIERNGKGLVERSCERGQTSGVFGIYVKA